METAQAKAIFWERFNHYTKQYSSTPFVTSLLSNHYQTLGYLKHGDGLPKLMNGIHGSVAKLVNDVLRDRKKLSGIRIERKRTSTDVSGMICNADGPIGMC